MTDEQITQVRQERTDVLAAAMQSGRWFMHARDGHLDLTPVPEGAYVITADQFAAVIGEAGGVPIHLLPEIVKAANSRLAQYIESSRNRAPLEQA